MSDENQEKSGEKKRPNNRNRNRNKNRNRNRKKTSSSSAGNGENSTGAQGSSKKNNNNNRRPKRRYKLSKDDAIYNKYLTMMEQHLAARKKYYALFDRADPQQKAKLERNYTSSMNKVRDFEDSLEGEDKEKFMTRVNGLNLDLTYSDNHEISPEHTDVPHSTEPEDPHYMETQKSSNFSGDTEESMGTLEDYQAYKGV